MGALPRLGEWLTQRAAGGALGASGSTAIASHSSLPFDPRFLAARKESTLIVRGRQARICCRVWRGPRYRRDVARTSTRGPPGADHGSGRGGPREQRCRSASACTSTDSICITEYGRRPAAGSCGSTWRSWPESSSVHIRLSSGCATSRPVCARQRHLTSARPPISRPPSNHRHRSGRGLPATDDESLSRVRRDHSAYRGEEDRRPHRLSNARRRPPHQG